jgi:hypothetical protein
MSAQNIPAELMIPACRGTGSVWLSSKPRKGDVQSSLLARRRSTPYDKHGSGCGEAPCWRIAGRR